MRLGGQGRIRVLAGGAAGLALACLLGGCDMIGFSATSPAPSVAVATPPADLPIGGLGAELGQKFDPADREVAYKAEIDAVTSGERRPWRGPHGAYGYVDAGENVVQTEGACRQYTQTVYLAGRPHVGKGLGCHQPDGTWHIVN